MSKLGIIGNNGSGKTSVCSYLETQGYTVLSLSDAIREEAKKRALSLDRDTLTALSNEIKKEQGEAVFAELAFEKAKGIDRVVFDSVRHVKEVAFLKERGVKMIGIEVPIEKRYDRIKARQRETDHIDFETFKRQDDQERLGKSFGQNIDACLQHCDTIINNDGDLPHLYRKIDQIGQERDKGI